MKSNIEIDLPLSIVLHEATDWKKFKTIQYPDGNWQLIIKRDEFDSLSKRLGFNYDMLKRNNHTLRIKNRVTKKSRTFKYLGLDTKNNIDHWFSEESKFPHYGEKRVDLFIELN